MKMTIHIYTVLLASVLLMLCHQPSFSENPPSTNEATMFSLSVTNDLGTEVATIRMPNADALHVLQKLYWVKDRSLGEQLLTNGILKLTGQSRAEAVAALKGNEPKRNEEIQGTIDRKFADHYGKERHFLYIRLPKADAFEILKAAMDVGDTQFRYQVMEFGLTQFKGTPAQEDVLSYLDKIFDTQEAMVQGNMLYVIRNIDLSSKYSIEILQKAMSVKGDGRIPEFVRKFAKDLDGYRRTGDPKLMEPYDVKSP